MPLKTVEVNAEEFETWLDTQPEEFRLRICNHDDEWSYIEDSSFCREGVMLFNPMNGDGGLLITPSAHHTYPPSAHHTYVFVHHYDGYICLGRHVYFTPAWARASLQECWKEWRGLDGTPQYSVLYRSALSNPEPELIAIYGYENDSTLTDHLSPHIGIPATSLPVETMRGETLHRLPDNLHLYREGRMLYAGTQDDLVFYAEDSHYSYIHVFEDRIRVGARSYTFLDQVKSALEPGGDEEVMWRDGLFPLYSILYQSIANGDPRYLGGMAHPAVPADIPSTECATCTGCGRCSPAIESERPWKLTGVSWDSYGSERGPVADEREFFLMAITAYQEEGLDEKRVTFKFEKGGEPVAETVSTECVVRAERDATIHDFLMTIARRESFKDWAVGMSEGVLAPDIHIPRHEGSSYVHLRQTGLLRNGCVTAYLVPREGMGISAYEVSFAYHRKGKFDRKQGNTIARLRYARGSYLVLAGTDRYETVARYFRELYRGQDGNVIGRGRWTVEHPVWLLPPEREIPDDIRALLARIVDTGSIDGDLLVDIEQVLAGRLPVVPIAPSITNMESEEGW